MRLYNISEMISVDNLLRGIDDAKYVRVPFYQPLQCACRLLLANLVSSSMTWKIQAPSTTVRTSVCMASLSSLFAHPGKLMYIH